MHVAREASVLGKEETREEHRGVPALLVYSESPAILTEDPLLLSSVSVGQNKSFIALL